MSGESNLRCSTQNYDVSRTFIYDDTVAICSAMYLQEEFTMYNNRYEGESHLWPLSHNSKEITRIYVNLQTTLLNGQIKCNFPFWQADPGVDLVSRHSHHYSGKLRVSLITPHNRECTQYLLFLHNTRASLSSPDCLTCTWHLSQIHVCRKQLCGVFRLFFLLFSLN